MSAFLSSFALIFISEMGDKTQLLALGLAARYRLRDVVLGITVAVLLLQGIAVLAGSLLGAVIPPRVLGLAAGISFIGFGLWTLRPERGEEDLPNKTVGWSRWGPAAVVGASFLLAELGDKTQLGTFALAGRFQAPWAVWAGAALGMLAGDGIGVAAGRFLHRTLPQEKIRRAAAFVFIVFGLWNLWDLL